MFYEISICFTQILSPCFALKRNRSDFAFSSALLVFVEAQAKYIVNSFSFFVFKTTLN
ncbi:hypothetical protein LEP1GSC089_0040 [Leptospira interrogans serovar Autumnalis str. LP101]|nr:hypothetical protein LEP1GSC089_0040 [Leptospira interrogans serovar Autumnalis str. LP101]